MRTRKGSKPDSNRERWKFICGASGNGVGNGNNSNDTTVDNPR